MVLAPDLLDAFVSPALIWTRPDFVHMGDAGRSDQRQRAADGIDPTRRSGGRGDSYHAVPVRTPVDPATRRKILDEVRKCGDAKARAVENAARSQDFLLRHRRLAGGIAVDTSALMAIVQERQKGMAALPASISRKLIWK